MSNEEEALAAIEHLVQEASCRCVVITLGSRGAVYRTAQGETGRVSAPTAVAMDTTVSKTHDCAGGQKQPYSAVNVGVVIINGSGIS